MSVQPLIEAGLLRERVAEQAERIDALERERDRAVSDRDAALDSLIRERDSWQAEANKLTAERDSWRSEAALAYENRDAAADRVVAVASERDAWIDAAGDLTARFEAAEAQIATLVEALEQIERKTDIGRLGLLRDGPQHQRITEAMELARAALAAASSGAASERGEG